MRSASTFRRVSCRIRSGTAPSAAALEIRARLSSSTRSCDKASIRSLFFSPRSRLQITASSWPLATRWPKQTAGECPSPGPSSTISPGNRACTCERRSASNISVPDISRITGAEDDSTVHVWTPRFVANSGGRQIASFPGASSAAGSEASLAPCAGGVYPRISRGVTTAPATISAAPRKTAITRRWAEMVIVRLLMAQARTLQDTSRGLCASSITPLEIIIRTCKLRGESCGITANFR